MLKKILLLAAIFGFQHPGWALGGSALNGGIASGAVDYLLHNEVLNNLADTRLRRDTGLNPDTYEYRHSPQVSAQVREEIMRHLIVHGYNKGLMDYEREAELRATLGQTDLVAVVARELDARGYNPNSLATAVAYWLIVNYNIIHGTSSTDHQEAAVLRQAQILLSRQPDMASVSDSEKQRMAEGMIWIASLQQYAYELAQQGAPGYDLGDVIADAHSALMTYGIDAYRLRLTANGFVPR